MSKLTKKEKEKMKLQMGISDRKTIEERGKQMRPVVFKDKRCEAKKKSCNKQNVKKEYEKYCNE